MGLVDLYFEEGPLKTRSFYKRYNEDKPKGIIMESEKTEIVADVVTPRVGVNAKKVALLAGAAFAATALLTWVGRRGAEESDETESNPS